jgi:hypothetical protein
MYMQSSALCSVLCALCSVLCCLCSVLCCRSVVLVRLLCLNTPTTTPPNKEKKGEKQKPPRHPSLPPTKKRVRKRYNPLLFIFPLPPPFPPTPPPPVPSSSSFSSSKTSPNLHGAAGWARQKPRYLGYLEMRCSVRRPPPHDPPLESRILGSLLALQCSTIMKYYN